MVSPAPHLAFHFEGGPMAQPALVRQPALANEPSGSGCVLPATQARYLSTIRQLLVEYQHARGSMQRQMFVKMVHAFMQDLCGYPPSSYIMTRTAYGNTEVDADPQVVAASDSGNSMLLYFTASE